MGESATKNLQAQQRKSTELTRRHTPAPPGVESPVHLVQRLQRSMGNHAVLRFMRAQRDQAEPAIQRGNFTRETARRGIAGVAGPLPHLDAIQRSFGHHDVSGVKAHTGAEAARANRELNSVGYTAGDHVAFAGSPDLYTAAHEAAHVVQQQKGVHLSGGVGRAGDEYERHADAVANLVVQNKSAESLLDKRGNGSRSKSNAPVQFQRAEKKKPPSKAKADPVTDALQVAFQRILEQQRLNEQINGAMAHELASAYLKSRKPNMIATPYGLKDLNFTIPATHDEIYQAILSGIDISKTGKGTSGWNWTPAPVSVEGAYRREAVFEILDFAKDEMVGDKVDKLRDEGIKKGAAWCAARWTAAEGLVVVAEMAVGVLTVVGWFSLAVSALELLITLQKPVKRAASKRELILEDVKNWIWMQESQAQMLKKAAIEDAKFKQRLTQPIKYELGPTSRDATRLGP